MGYSVTYMAVRGKSKDKVIQELGLTASGDFKEEPDWGTVGAYLRDGWYLIYNDYHHDSGLDLSGEQLAVRISAEAETLSCFIEEHVMVSSCRCWKNGQLIWAVEHESERGLDHLAVQGTPPESWKVVEREARDQLKSDPDPCDYLFSAPPELFKVLTGFKYDEGDQIAATDGAGFEILVRHGKKAGAIGKAGSDKKAGAKPWWKIW